MTFDIVTIWHFVLTIWHLTMWKFAIWQFDIVDIWHCWHLPLLTSDIVDIWHWQAISQWLMDQPPLSIKHQDQLARLEGRLALCPSCPGLHRAPSPMSSMHALLIFISTFILVYIGKESVMVELVTVRSQLQPESRNVRWWASISLCWGGGQWAMLSNWACSMYFKKIKILYLDRNFILSMFYLLSRMHLLLLFREREIVREGELSVLWSCFLLLDLVAKPNWGQGQFFQKLCQAILQ